MGGGQRRSSAKIEAKQRYGRDKLDFFREVCYNERIALFRG